MVVKYFKQILYMTGVVTMLGILQFLLPRFALGLSGLQVSEGAGLAFAKHWGMMAFCFGALLIYAANHNESRRPIVFATAAEKLGMVVIIALGWNDPLLAGLRPVLFSDGATVLLYGIYLFSGASSNQDH